MRQVRLDTVRRGEFFKRTATSYKVYIRGDYTGVYHNRYSCIDTEDANREIFLKGNHMVFVGFTY